MLQDNQAPMIKSLRVKRPLLSDNNAWFATSMRYCVSQLWMNPEWKNKFLSRSEAEITELQRCYEDIEKLSTNRPSASQTSPRLASVITNLAALYGDKRIIWDPWFRPPTPSGGCAKTSRTNNKHRRQMRTGEYIQMSGRPERKAKDTLG